MELDEELCLCFHVTKRKVVNYIRVEKPSSSTQLSECFGAGTGCGWCRPFLKKLHEEARQQNVLGPLQENRPDRPTPSTFTGASLSEMTATEYAELRRQYVNDGKGTPPGGSEPRSAKLP